MDLDKTDYPSGETDPEEIYPSQARLEEIRELGEKRHIQYWENTEGHLIRYEEIMKLLDSTKFTGDVFRHCINDALQGLFRQETARFFRPGEEFIPEENVASMKAELIRLIENERVSIREAKANLINRFPEDIEKYVEVRDDWLGYEEQLLYYLEPLQNQLLGNKLEVLPSLLLNAVKTRKIAWQEFPTLELIKIKDIKGFQQDVKEHFLGLGRTEEDDIIQCIFYGPHYSYFDKDTGKLLVKASHMGIFWAAEAERGK